MKPEDIERIKKLLPTDLGSAELRDTIAADILRSSIFSARMSSASYLAAIREVCAQISAGSINQAKARELLLSELSRLGYSTEDSNALDNPAAQRRLDLIIDMQRQMAASVARLAGETEDTLDMYPAWELTRADSPAAPREDWPARWNLAGNSVDWEGAYRHIYNGSGVGVSFVALKTSPIWDAIGAGVGGFADAVGNPYPPFAFGSYMDWFDVNRDTCLQLGLIKEDEHVAPGEVPTLSPDDQELLEAAEQVGWPNLFDDLN